MPNYSVFPPQTVAVTTATTVFTVDCFKSSKTWVQVDNLSATETVAGTIQLRLDDTLPWASSSFPDFAAILPLASAVAVIDSDMLNQMRMIATSTGAGANVNITVKDVPKR